MVFNSQNAEIYRQKRGVGAAAKIWSLSEAEINQSRPMLVQSTASSHRIFSSNLQGFPRALTARQYEQWPLLEPTSWQTTFPAKPFKDEKPRQNTVDS